jgi:hypothetical protein
VSGSPNTTAGTGSAGKAAAGGSAAGRGGANGAAGGSPSAGMASAGAPVAGSPNGGSFTGGSGGGADPNHCAFGWRDDPCGQTCLTQTQSNTKRCADILDCYIQNDCTPDTCSLNDQKCGQNTLKVDAAPFPAAKTVYDCLCKT